MQNPDWLCSEPGCEKFNRDHKPSDPDFWHTEPIKTCPVHGVEMDFKGRGCACCTADAAYFESHNEEI